MKALTLTQPWASFLVNERSPGGPAIKGWETRGWKPGEKILAQIRREGFLVHAGIRIPKVAIEISKTPMFQQYIAGMPPLPIGKIIGHVTIGEIIKTEHWITKFNHFEDGAAERPAEEYHFGNYEPGRYAYELTSFRRFVHQPIVPGHLNFWDYDPQICIQCGCTDNDCRHCIEKTGSPCSWILPFLCSACNDQEKNFLEETAKMI